MTIYYVTEYITQDMVENAEGYYSTKEKAQEAILARVAEEYTPEEMKSFHFDEIGETYITTDNEYIAGCTYYISPIELDKEII